MPEKEKSESTLAQQLANFKRQNPKVAEAMELFGITLAKYQERHVLRALYHVPVSGPTLAAKTCTKLAPLRNIVDFCCDLIAKQIFLGGLSLFT